MARVPTWTELRLDAKKLARLQKECYHSVHRLLDLEIPELDRKISMLSGRSLSSQESTPSIQEEYQESADSFAPIPQFEPASTFQTHYMTQENNLTTNKTLMSPPEADEVVTSIVEPVEYLPEKREQDVILPEPSTIRQPLKKNRVCNPRVVDLDDNPHLKAPPLPLSEYLVRNRPEVVRRANKRVSYLKRKAERRRIRLESMAHSFKRLKLSSNRHQPMESNRIFNPPKPKHNYAAPSFNVRYKLSETEMKELTARTYRRLPEVKMRHKEEVTIQMRALNHKNKLEYARKLSENRKNGIINYPLTSSYDDRSITSSQSEYSMNSYTGSADMHRFELH